MQCIDHLNFANEICPDCKLLVDDYGNTEYQFQYCSFPCCGCDGARLCMAGTPNGDAEQGNVEGMWSNGKKLQCRKAVLYTMGIKQKTKSN